MPGSSACCFPLTEGWQGLFFSNGKIEKTFRFSYKIKYQGFTVGLHTPVVVK
jgi:hypothetical protein